MLTDSAFLILGQLSFAVSAMNNANGGSLGARASYANRCVAQVEAMIADFDGVLTPADRRMIDAAIESIDTRIGRMFAEHTEMSAAA